MQVKTYHAKTNVEHRGTKQRKKHYFLCCKDPGGYFTTSTLSREICSIFKMHHIMSRLGFCFVFSFLFSCGQCCSKLNRQEDLKTKNHFKFPKRGPCCVWLSSSIVKNAIAFPQYVQKICGFSPTTSPALVIKSILPPRDYSLYVHDSEYHSSFPALPLTLQSLLYFLTVLLNVLSMSCFSCSNLKNKNLGWRAILFPQLLKVLY